MGACEVGSLARRCGPADAACSYILPTEGSTGPRMVTVSVGPTQGSEHAPSTLANPAPVVGVPSLRHADSGSISFANVRAPLAPARLAAQSHLRSHHAQPPSLHRPHARRTRTVPRHRLDPPGRIHRPRRLPPPGRHGYVLMDGDICFTTFRKSQKVLNLKRDPKLTVMLESGKGRRAQGPCDRRRGGDR